MLLVNSSLRAADRAAGQSFRMRSRLQPDDPFPLEFSLFSTGDDVDVDAIQDSISNFPIARGAESLETTFANFDGDSLNEQDQAEGKSAKVVYGRPETGESKISAGAQAHHFPIYDSASPIRRPDLNPHVTRVMSGVPERT